MATNWRLSNKGVDLRNFKNQLTHYLDLPDLMGAVKQLEKYDPNSYGIKYVIKESKYERDTFAVYLKGKERL